MPQALCTQNHIRVRIIHMDNGIPIFVGAADLLCLCNGSGNNILSHFAVSVVAHDIIHCCHLHIRLGCQCGVGIIPCLFGNLGAALTLPAGADVGKSLCEQVAHALQRIPHLPNHAALLAVGVHVGIQLPHTGRQTTHQILQLLPQCPVSLFQRRDLLGGIGIGQHGFHTVGHHFLIGGVIFQSQIVHLGADQCLGVLPVLPVLPEQIVCQLVEALRRVLPDHVGILVAEGIEHRPFAVASGIDVQIDVAGGMVIKAVGCLPCVPQHSGYIGLIHGAPPVRLLGG